MNDKNDGRPAFPSVKTARQYTTDINVHSVGGMTLRDYFAAKAMAAVIMNPETQRELANMGRDEGMKVISTVAYMQADAMLAAQETV